MQIKKDRNRNKSNLGDTALLHCENSMVQVCFLWYRKDRIFRLCLSGRYAACMLKGMNEFPYHYLMQIQQFYTGFLLMQRKYYRKADSMNWKTTNYRLCFCVSSDTIRKYNEIRISSFKHFIEE